MRVSGAPTLLCMPDGYTAAPTVMSNFDHTIDTDVANRLREREEYAPYAGYHFCGYVWWDRPRARWACEVWHYQVHMDTVTADTLEAIMREVSDKWGWD